MRAENERGRVEAVETGRRLQLQLLTSERLDERSFSDLHRSCAARIPWVQ